MRLALLLSDFPYGQTKIGKAIKPPIGQAVYEKHWARVGQKLGKLAIS
jgi:hypothetical protein